MIQKIKKIYASNPIIREIFFYGIIGITAASLDALIYYLLTRGLNFNEFVANFVGINLGIALSFYLNAFYNFKKTDMIKARAIRFFLVGYIGLLLSMMILYLGTRVLAFNDMYVKIASVFIVAVFQFIFNKFITFGGKKQ